MKDEDFMLTPEETRLQRRKRRIIVIIALALVLVIVAGVFGARPAAGVIRGWQARRHAQKAFALIKKEQWSDARAEAIAAYQLRPGEPQALRAVARFLTRTRQPEALDFWKQLDERHRLTAEDRRDEATIAIIAADNERAEAAVRELISSKDAGPTEWLLAAQLAIQKNLRGDARTYLDKIIADPRTSETQQFQASLLQLALAGNDQTERANAIARLKKIAAEKTAASLDALVVLAQNALSVPTEGATAAASPTPTEGIETPPPIVGKDEIADLVQALDNHPLAKAQHKLLALDLLLHVDASQRDAIVARAVNGWKDAAPADLASLGAWLNAKGEFQKTLDTIPFEKAVQSRDLFLQHLDALAALDRWSEVKQLLTGEKFPLDPVVQHMYLARCSTQLGEQTAAANSWQRALEATAGDPGKLMTLADYAEKNGNAEIAEAAYNSAAAIPPRLRVAQQGRLRLAHASHDTKKLHAILVEMLALWPNDPAIQNDEAYTRLLLLPADTDETKREAVAIEQLAEKLIEREPASLPHRTLLALARLRQGRPEGALNVYADLRVAQNALSSSALAVHAATLAATAHPEDAKTEAGQIKREELLPEERSLIETLLD
jgi:hypothetical protein